MVPVPVTVKPALEALKGFPDTARVQVPDPIAKVLVAVPAFVKNEPALDIVQLYTLASNVPDVSDKPWLIVIASCSVTDPLGLSMVNPCVKVLPALVMV